MLYGLTEQPCYNTYVKGIMRLVEKRTGIPSFGFATNGINISKLESYLLNGKFFSARFYVEVQHHLESKALQYALAELKFFSEEYQVLGCYPAHNYRHKKQS